jgi:hypothetical protein
MQKTQFECSRCGVCCQHLERNALYAALHRGDGICQHFNAEQRECSIYENRPLLCRIDEAYTAFFVELFSIAEYHQLMRESCAFLQSLPPKNRG